MKFTRTKAPSDYLEGLKENWQADSMSGLLVFLIAMPLSLGIAKASDFPPVMGLLTAITGGLIVSLFSGSHLSIKGPAAGLIVIVSGAVHSFGGGEHGWHLALGTIVAAGLMQILFGVFKLGSLSEFFPSAVIHGMLAAIGLIIFSKQIYTLAGVDPKETTGMNPMELYTNIPKLITHGNLKIFLIGIICLAIVFGLPRIKNRFIKRVPSPLIVLTVAIPMAYFLDFQNTLPPFAMVKIGKFLEQIRINADFSGISQTGIFIKYVILFALIGSIESLLTVKAMDGLDPYKRKSDYNKDVIAIGIGNVIAGVLGGLPMISEVARSSANVNNGARTRWANFFHGFFLLTAVLFAPSVMEMIPNAALAALLIGVGYRLASPKEFINTYKVGPEQLVIFITTIIFTIADDLLVGVIAGILMDLLIGLMNGAPLKTIFRINSEVREKESGQYELKILSPATFSNLISFKSKIEPLPKSASVTLDFSRSKFTDHTFMEMLHGYEEEFHRNGGNLVLAGFENHHFLSQHPYAARKFVKNPAFASRNIILTKRQTDLSEYAMKNGLEFEPKLSSKFIRLSLSNFSVIRKTTNIDNLLIGHTENYNFFFADVYMEEGSYLTKMGKSITIMHISNLTREVPNFTLEKEGLLDIIGLSSKKDIDFPSAPEFSGKYYLTGDNEEDIRHLFTPELIRFFDKNDHLFMESINGGMVIHSNEGLLESKDLDNFRQLIATFMDLVLKQSGQ